MALSSKLMHYAAVSLYTMSGMSPNSTFRRDYLSYIMGVPVAHTFKGIRSEDLYIQNVREPSKRVRIRIFEDLNNQSKEKPVFLYIHGGGYVLDFSLNYDEHCRKIAREGMIVIAVIYRVAPEEPFPAQINDCFSVARWLENPNTELLQNANLKKLCIGGDSAGGNLTAVLCTLIRDEKIKIQVSAQLLIYPGIWIRPPMPSYHRTDKRYMLTKSVKEFFTKSVMGNHNPDDFYNSPLLNPLKNRNGLSGLPPTYLLTVDIDPLRDEGDEYGKQLRKAGVSVLHTEYTRTFHGFWNMTFATRYNEAYAEMMKFIREKLNF